MRNKFTIITIGMPVYNGEEHLSATLDSILSQTFADFELIISNNASTDATPRICDEYARMDSRVHVFHQPTNIGGARNWNFVVSKAHGQYFKWASGNDICEPRMLEMCKQALDDHPDCVLAYPETRLIDGSGKVIRDYDDPLDASDPDPVQRFRSTTLSLALNNAQCGLIRTDVLRRTGLEGLYAGGDLPLMAELALLGRFCRLPDRLFLRRVSPESSTIGNCIKRLRVFNQVGDLELVMSSSLRQWMDYLRIVNRSSLPPRAKLKLYSYLFKILFWGLPSISKETIEELQIWLNRRITLSGF